MSDAENKFVKKLVDNMSREELKHFASEYLISLMKDKIISANLMNSKFLKTKIA
tara:strand:- start:1454 stop:1615 length:162 start_codon:yes stop_codon:yes gene_type:complete